MRMKFAGLMITLGLATALPVWAHHAFAAEFDAQKPVKLKGSVTKMEWVNPHAWIHIDVKEADGKTTAWMIECGTPNNLFRQGLNKNSIQPGTEVVVEGFQSKDGSNRANGRNVTFPDGRSAFLSNPGTSSDDKGQK